MDNSSIFKLFVTYNCQRHDLFEKVVEQVKLENNKACGELASTIYDQLRLLSNSVNNTGWQDRHSEHIQMINDMMGNISNEFEEFLP